MFTIAGLSDAIYNVSKLDLTDFLRFHLDDAIKSNMDPIGYLVHEYLAPTADYSVRRYLSPDHEKRLQTVLFNAMAPFRGALLAAREWLRNEAAKANEAVEEKQAVRFQRIANGEIHTPLPVAGPFDAFEALWPEEQEEINKKKAIRRIKLKLRRRDELTVEEETLLESVREKRRVRLPKEPGRWVDIDGVTYLELPSDWEESAE